MAAREQLVTVIVPVRDEARLLEQSLRAVLEGDYPRDRLEVLVVDGGSTDDSRAIAARIQASDGRVRVIDNPSRSAAAGLNVGLAAARGDIVVRLDGHALPAADYVRRCVAALDRTGADVVGGTMVGRGDTLFGRAVALAQATPLGSGGARYRLGGEGPTDTVYLGAWRRETLERLGGFDESLVHNQDAELCLRIRESGGLVWLDPAIHTTTMTRSTPRDLAAQYFGYGLGRAATAARHPTALAARQAIPALFVAGSVAGAVGAVVARELRMPFALVLAAYAAVVAISSLRIARRAGRECLVPSIVAFVTMHVSWGTGFWIGLASELARRLATRAAATPRWREGKEP